ncbi:hypothetical protein EX30DRAFT_392743 [Ascodesmis nigricans]|uniref:Uncharacterized protein n=1 Tax=Ascodesmis nigricans TaxID=341454 RepID=A0A4S2N879_9PEZI|nr:hypothetical protein EX30DRAFT_392743 [Ascodesmis nigricans]
MVLHNSKWDRKATKDRARKFKSKGKDLPEIAAQKAAQKAAEKALSQQSRSRQAPVDPNAPPLPAESRVAGDVSDDHEDGETSESEDEMGGIYLGTSPPLKKQQLDPTPAEAQSSTTAPQVVVEEEDDADHPHGKFSKRKLISNSYRYELPPSDDPHTTTEPPNLDPEPDYVALTTSRVSALEKEEARRKEQLHQDRARLDAAFLREMDRGGYGGKGEREYGFGEEEKAKVVKVDRSEFVELQEKIRRRENVEAFRKRFGGSGGKGAGRGGSKGGGGKEDVEDVDAFLMDLGLEDTKPTGSRKPAALSTADKTGGSHRGPLERKKAEEEDEEWLDAMLEVR